MPRRIGRVLLRPCSCGQTAGASDAPRQTNIPYPRPERMPRLGASTAHRMAKDSTDEALAAGASLLSHCPLDDLWKRNALTNGRTTRSPLSLLKRYWPAFRERRPSQSFASRLGLPGRHGADGPSRLARDETTTHKRNELERLRDAPTCGAVVCVRNQPSHVGYALCEQAAVNHCLLVLAQGRLVRLAPAPTIGKCLRLLGRRLSPLGHFRTIQRGRADCGLTNPLPSRV